MHSFIQQIFEHLLCANVVLGTGDMPRGDMIQRRCDSYLLGACRLGRETGIKKYCNDTSNSNVAIPTSGLSFDLLLTLILDTALLFFLVNK